jgi:membrane protease YdiL (CAAX protease family)
MAEPLAVHASSPAPIDEAHELRVALALTALVLLTLTIVKPLGSLAVIGTIGYTVAAALQLYLPLWRADRLRAPIAIFGLHTRSWRRDLRLVALLCAVTFPPYALAHHLYMTAAHDWAWRLGLYELARLLPRRTLALHTPVGLAGWGSAAWWLGQIVVTHLLGVALPEEAFYRGYLQPRLASRLPPRYRVCGVPFGLAAVLTALLFAAGHFLGEWNPLRLGPFFPALLFAWLRNATGSVTGAVAYHASCNVFGELLFTFYQPR